MSRPLPSPVLEFFRLYPEEISVTRMLLRRDASLLEAAAHASRAPATAAGDARFWQEAALEENRARAFFDPGRYLN